MAMPKKIKKLKIRVPLPKQAPKVKESAKKYNRKKEKKYLPGRINVDNLKNSFSQMIRKMPLCCPTY